MAKKLYFALLNYDSDAFAILIATARLRKFGKYGISLRKSEGADVANPSAGEQKTIDEINKFLADENTKPEDVKKRFGLKTESQAKAIQKVKVFTSKAQFLEATKRLGNGVSGFAAWNRFTQNKPQTTPASP